MPQSNLEVKVLVSPLATFSSGVGRLHGYRYCGYNGKQRQQVDDLEIVVSGERVNEPLRVYNKIHVEYKIKDKDIKEKAV